MMSTTYKRSLLRHVPNERAAFSSMSLSKAKITNLPLPIGVLLLTVLLPTELDFNVGHARLNAMRVVLLVFCPIAMVRMLLGRGPAIRSGDILFIGAFVWYALAIFWKEPLEKAIQSGGIVFLEAVGGYFMARAYIRNAEQFLASVKLLFLIVLIAGSLAIPESLFSVHVAHNLAGAISGVPPVPGGEYRLGLMRAMSAFDHPILYGVFCTGVFGLVWYTEPDVLKRVFRASLVMVAAFFCLSAAPLQGIALVLGGAAWERVTRQIPGRMWLTIAFSVLVYVFLSFASNRPPVVVLVSSFVFDQDSIWYRFQIWDYAIDTILRNPFVGAPLGFWDRPKWMVSSSVDSYWLTVALWGGLPAFALYAFSIVLLLRRVHNRIAIARRPELRGCKYGWTATVLSLCAVGATVHYWGALGVMFTFYLGMGMWLGEPARKTRPEPGPALMQ